MSAEMTPSRPAARVFAGSGIAVVVAGTVALLTRQPWLFPSPTCRQMPLWSAPKEG